MSKLEDTYGRVRYGLVRVTISVVGVGQVFSGLALVDEGSAHGVENRLSVLHGSHTVKNGHGVEVLSHTGLSVSGNVVELVDLVVELVVDRGVHLVRPLVILVGQGVVADDLPRQIGGSSKGLVPKNVDFAQGSSRRSLVREITWSRGVLPSGPVSGIG
jgi:hypothetical protein